MKAGFLTVVNITGATEDNIYDELYSWFNNLGIIMDVDGDIITLDVETNVYTNDEDTLSNFISITPDPIQVDEGKCYIKCTTRNKYSED